MILEAPRQINKSTKEGSVPVYLQNSVKSFALGLATLFLASTTLFAQARSTSEAKPSIGEKTAGMQKFPGYYPFYWDAKAGKLWLEIDKWNTEFLYVESLPAGIGSNDIGLDRGQL